MLFEEGINLKKNNIKQIIWLDPDKILIFTFDSDIVAFDVSLRTARAIKLNIPTEINFIFS